jgi:WD40 repeat protein
MKIAEEIYDPITSLYNCRPDTKVTFVIKDVSDYSNGATYFFDHKIEIWASALDFELRGTHNWLRNVVSHEFAHDIQMQGAMKFGRRLPGFYFQWLGYESEGRPDVLYGFPNVLVSYPIPGAIVPAWFAEGVAQYNRPEFGYETWDSHRDMILRMYALDGKMLSWSEMGGFGKTGLGNESSYNAGYSLVNYIAKTYGEGKLDEISRNLSRFSTLTVDDAIYRSLGKTGNELYGEWKGQITETYAKRIAPVKSHLVQGELIADVGFGNFYPTFSPDGKKIAYVSNKEADYFGLSSLYVYNLEAKGEGSKEELAKEGVRSALSWSPEGDKIVYSKLSPPDTHGDVFYDIYVFDFRVEEETRLTEGLRAYNPSFSSDGKRIVFVTAKDGTTNMGLMNVDGSNFRLLTNFKNGEQIYSPRWSPARQNVVLDTSSGTLKTSDLIVFDYFVKDGRDIAAISFDTTLWDPRFRILITGNDDCRNPAFTPDGKKIVYSSDRTGIFNIYAYDLASGATEQLTNVLGGAFMPSMNKQGELTFAAYTSSGYKIAFIREAREFKVPGSDYASGEAASTLVASLAETGISPRPDWNKLKNYDDTQVPSYESRPYKSIFTSISFFPFLRIDNCNKQNKGIDVIKPGLFFLSNEMLEKYGIFGGAAINRQLERDLFLTFEYKDRLPLLYRAGITPSISLELYNVTRKTSANIELPQDTIGVDVGFNLFEFDAIIAHKIINNSYDLKLGYRHSRYSSTIGDFILPESFMLVKATDNLYFIGNDISINLKYRGIVPSSTMDVNPVGRRVELRYDYEFNKFNSDGQYEVIEGLLLPVYKHYNFHRVEFTWNEYWRLPFWKHTLGLSLRGGTIFGPPVDNFFDYYAGGLVGMRGYPYYGLGGNKIATVNVSYRFPISDNMDFRVLQIYFDKLYVSVFGDYGNAWTDSPMILKNFKRDAGFELRLETYSFYVYPTRIFFSAAYGFDEFSRDVNKVRVDYGREWRLYFGVLFGFDIGDTE